MAARVSILQTLGIRETEHSEKSLYIKLLISSIKEPRVDLSNLGSASDFASNAASVSTMTRLIPNVASQQTPGLPYRPWFQHVGAGITKSAELALQLQHHHHLSEILMTIHTNLVYVTINLERSYRINCDAPYRSVRTRM